MTDPDEVEAQLAEHVAAIQALHHDLKRDAFEIGWRLIAIKQLKQQTPHGSFLPYLKRQFHFGVRTAQRMMNAAEKFAGQYDTVSHLPIHLTAIYLLAGPGVAGEAREDAIKIAQAGRTVTKAVAKAIIKRLHNGDGDGDADPFGGLTDDDYCRLTGTLGFFRDRSDLRRSKQDLRRHKEDLRRAREGPLPPPGEIVPRLEWLVRGIEKLRVGERNRIRKQVGFLGEKIRDRHFARMVRREVADLVIGEFADDDDNFALLLERIEGARESRRPAAA
jgi:hypothetical protein